MTPNTCVCSMWDARLYYRLYSSIRVAARELTVNLMDSLSREKNVRPRFSSRCLKRWQCNHSNDHSASYTETHVLEFAFYGHINGATAFPQCCWTFYLSQCLQKQQLHCACLAYKGPMYPLNSVQ